MTSRGSMKLLMRSPQWGWLGLGVVLQDDCLVQRPKGKRGEIERASITDAYVARPAGLWPGMCVSVETKQGRVDLHSLCVDVGIPSSSQTHQELQECAEEIKRWRQIA